MLAALVLLILWGSPETLLKEHRGEILEASRAFGISPRLLASVVYAERSSNIRPGEDVVDVVLARTGYNSSVGLAQVKVETAFWITEQLSDPKSLFYLSPEEAQILSPPKGRQELIDQLAGPRKNLLYAAAYLAIIGRHWTSVIQSTQTTSDRVALIATLYSLGLERADGSIRNPHTDAKPNRFGEIAREFYDSFLLREDFPQ